MRDSARLWLLLLAGPTIGFVHLGLVYALASLSERPLALAGGGIRVAIAAVSLTAILINSLLILAAWRDRLPAAARRPDAEGARFWRAGVGVGAAISLTTVVWQVLPIFVV